MTRCLNCGEELSPDQQRCGTCGTDLELLDEIRSVHDQPRYLFGSVELPQNNVDPKEEPPTRRSEPRQPEELTVETTSVGATSVGATSVGATEVDEHDPTPPMRREEATPARKESQPEVLTGSLFDTTFLEEEPQLPSPRPQPEWRPSWVEHLLAIAVDFGFLVLLNSIILGIISYQTAREVADLITHSFLPLLLVHLAFSGILFFLFAHFFGHSPGSLLLRKFRKEDASVP